MMPPAFAPFAQGVPLAVMTRLAAENLFRADRLDALFDAVATRQYRRSLKFSQVVELMMAVVTRVDDSVLSAYRARKEALGVSDQAVYDKLRGVETGLSAALVADSADRIAPVIDRLNARLAPWVAGLRTRVVDGNLLGKTESRLRELRQTRAAALPGRVVAVYEPETDLVTRVVLNRDAHDSERRLLDEVLAGVAAGDLWVADRNFCTRKFLFGLAGAGAKFAIRQHGSLAGRALGERVARGRTEGGRAFEQRVELDFEGATLRVRRVTVLLDRPTRGGDAEVHVLTNLTGAQAKAARVAEVYRKRWTIEDRFFELATTLNGEPNTLGYPAAALFAFSLALVASNAVALPPESWEVFRGLEAEALAEALRELAGRVKPGDYRKATRGPKKPPAAKGRYKNGGHVATQRLIDQRKKAVS